ncbi:MAG: type II CRISPR-associated endonuclease Cas1, partial [Planctomycetes bacterium]|nr:type II CRISPR-associated endonuclease Cas1 [Planctomycetota bacterium]
MRRRSSSADLRPPRSRQYTPYRKAATPGRTTRPCSKRIWRQIVRAKIRAQADLLGPDHEKYRKLLNLENEVRSGDPSNVEAQAARRYWPLLLGPDFRRDRGLPGVNALLNYGYTVLRAGTSRAVVAAGLHPSLGVHHRTRTDPFCLASDLMEPFRPLVDLAASRLADAGVDDVTPEAKTVLAAVLSADLQTSRGTTPSKSARFFA